MEISAKEVMALRQKTGAGMMDCKKALAESNGDVDKAVTILREKGIAKAAKRAEREAQEGIVSAYLSPDGKIGVVLEINCETDFVARTDDFQTFARKIMQAVIVHKPQGDAWRELLIDGIKACEAVDQLSAKMGEKMELRRCEVYQSTDGRIDTYLHGEGRLGVMLEYGYTGDENQAAPIAHDLSMQIAAANPIAINRDQVPAAAIEQEMEIYRQQARNEGKPENIVDKIAQGKLNKFYSEACLLDQPFVKEQKIAIRDYLQNQAKATGAKVEPRRFLRFQLGAN